ncbi:MAG TPA: archease [Nitrospiria bacterium]|jgi:SHS2 domain-containing protein|nr:archease [Nitrospiria bacterium]
MGEFNFLEGIVTADVAVAVRGKTIEDLFATAALALFEVMVGTETVQPQREKKLRLEGPIVDRLLYDWLSELVCLKDTDSMLFCRFDLVIKQENGYQLYATIAGEEIDPKRHELRADVKAVTFHRFHVEERQGLWNAEIVFDI